MIFFFYTSLSILDNWSRITHVRNSSSECSSHFSLFSCFKRERNTSKHKHFGGTRWSSSRMRRRTSKAHSVSIPINHVKAQGLTSESKVAETALSFETSPLPCVCLMPLRERDRLWTALSSQDLVLQLSTNEKQLCRGLLMISKEATMAQ